MAITSGISILASAKNLYKRIFSVSELAVCRIVVTSVKINIAVEASLLVQLYYNRVRSDSRRLTKSLGRS